MTRGLGKVYLIGAGPGDPELITMRAMRRLGEADVVLYDALVHPALLERVATHAEVVYVGKRAGRPSERQTRINERMLSEVQAGRVVVRLKGGDPYLFGRGSEEAEFLATHGVSFEVVPGVPSPIAATAYAGISLTHRSRSSSVAYLTATESVEKDVSTHDWAKLATGPQTLVIFMGMRKLAKLMALLMEHGRAADTPAAVIQWASLPKQRTVVGTVATIAELARAQGLGLPALTVVGDVVELRDTLRWYDRQPLFGKRVLVTRPAHQAEPLARGLRDAGAEALCTPMIAIAPPTDTERMRETIASMPSCYRWLVFTSVNGVQAFFETLPSLGRDTRCLGGVRVAAIGPATAKALHVFGVRPDVVPTEFRGEALAEAILAEDPALAGHEVLIARAEVAREALPQRLRAEGVKVTVLPVYRSQGPSDEVALEARDAIHRRQVDMVCFTSPSTAHNLHSALGDHADALSTGFTLAAIGPVTADAMRALGWPVHVQGDPYTCEGLIAALNASVRAEREA